MRFRLKRTFHIKIYVFAAVFLILLLLCMGIYRINKLYCMRTVSYASNTAVLCMNNAVKNTLNENENNEFIEVINPNKETQPIIKSNAAVINNFKSSVTVEVLRLLNETPTTEIKIPIGSILGIPIFNSCGLKIPARLTPVSDVRTDFYDKFESVGINHVKYSLYAKIETEMAILSYFKQTQQKVSTSVLISETIISGDVPSYYAVGGDTSGISALMPDENVSK